MLNNVYKAMVFKGLLVFGSFFLSWGNNTIYAQYRLPKLALLAEQGIRTLHVSKTAVRMETMDKVDITDASFNRSSIQMVTYFFSAKGVIDSIYYFPNDSTGYAKKDVLRYTRDAQLVEYSTITREGIIESRTLAENTAENEWYYRQWDRGELKTEIKSTADSVIYEKVIHRTYRPSHNYVQYTSDLVNSITTETWYNDQEILAQETYIWVANNNIPSHLIQTTYKAAEGRKKPKNETKQFDVDTNGVVINELNGLVFDPFRLDNYFERFERFKGVESPHIEIFTLDSLIIQKEVNELYSFDGTSIIYRYNMTYKK